MRSSSPSSSKKNLSYHDLGFAKVDRNRLLRRKFPEVIYAKGKTAPQIIAIARSLQASGAPVVITKLKAQVAPQILKAIPGLTFYPRAKMAISSLVQPGRARFRRQRGLVLVLTAGTSDLPIAEEAVLTLRLMGCRVKCLADVGVAGLHRLFAHLSLLRKAQAVVVVAGMDGALPSVVSGLVARPVVAVPTSVGYGASFRGVAPLLTMLNSCSPGVAVVNIDNGFGAGYLAGIITDKSSE